MHHNYRGNEEADPSLGASSEASNLAEMAVERLSVSAEPADRGQAEMKSGTTDPAKVGNVVLARTGATEAGSTDRQSDRRSITCIGSAEPMEEGPCMTGLSEAVNKNLAIGTKIAGVEEPVTHATKVVNAGLDVMAEMATVGSALIDLPKVVSAESVTLYSTEVVSTGSVVTDVARMGDV